MTPDQEAAREWLAARKVIADALIEWGMVDNECAANRDGAAIIARLAHHDPMIVAEFAGATAKRIVARIREAANRHPEGGTAHYWLNKVADEIESEEV